MVMDRERPIEPALLERLCALVSMAPNHKKTAPWRIATFTGERRAALGEAFRVDCIRSATDEIPDSKLEKTRTKYGRAPAVIVVGCAPAAGEVRHREDLYACAAGVQNLLLGATAAGLISLWSSPPAITAETVCRLAAFPFGTELVAVVYLGHPAG